MYRLLHFPFASPKLVRLPEVLVTSPTAPIATLLELLTDALGEKGLYALYPRLFTAYVDQFNWSYRDGYPELRFIQTAFIFTLYLLTRYGNNRRPHTFYEDSFLRAFPMLLDELPRHQIFTREEELRQCYTWRTLVHFVGFFGLATVEPDSDKRLHHEYRVKSLPLLRDTVQFQLSEK